MSSPINRREFLKLLSLLPAAALSRPSVLGAEPSSLSVQKPPNIIFLVFDTFSASNASIYGYRRETTPNIERFAGRSTVYHAHYAGGSFTPPGTASLLTGTHPWTHRALHKADVAEKLAGNNIFNLFSVQGYHQVAYTHNHHAMPLLAQFRQWIDLLKWPRELALADELLADRGFTEDYSLAVENEKWILIDQDPPPNSPFLSVLRRYLHMLRTLKLSRDFKSLFPRGVPTLLSMFYLLEDAVDWLMDQLLVLPQPYLVYYHLLPPHNPYNTRQEFIDIFQDGWNPEPKPESYFSEGVSNQRLNANRRLYDEYIPYADAEFGRLVDFLNRKGLLDNSLVVLTSDHGEMFERGILGHNTPTLYQPLIRVPLLISRPRQTEREDVYTNTSCVDVLPTLLRAAGQPIPGWCEGAVLPPFSDKIEKDRDIYTVEAKSSPKFAPLNKATISLVKGDYKLIHYRGYGSGIPPYELYSLTNDPEERVDLYGSQKGVADEMTGILLQKLAQVNQPYEKKSAL